MSAAMDRAMATMGLDDDDVPCEMPNFPGFSSSEANFNSLIGRVLNPNGVRMSNLILDMPRKWQKVGRVRGVALSNERFQFMFETEHDLLEILEKGVHTFNEWTLVLERWEEVPSATSLQFLPLWIRLRGIPVNRRTVVAISWIAEKFGQVKEVALDVTKPQCQDFVRVKILFDVSRPLRRSKAFNLPSGEPFTIFVDYERIQKRCYECLRLNHDTERCPLIQQKQQDLLKERRGTGVNPKHLAPIQNLQESDPLFGVLRDDQVGIDPLSGRPRIADEVLSQLRQYLVVDNGDAPVVKEDRVKTTVAEAECNPITRKTVLQLEPPPIVSADVNKGKGLVFEYDSAVSSTRDVSHGEGKSTFLKDAIKAGEAMLWKPASAHTLSDGVRYKNFDSHSTFGSTVQGLGLYEAGSSGTKRKGGKPRKRQVRSKRKLLPRDVSLTVNEADLKPGALRGSVTKRQVCDELLDGSNGAKRQKPVMVPKEGLSSI